MNPLARKNRKAIVIAVWGNGGSGKTLFSCILAKKLTHGGASCFLLSPDDATPMLPVLCPNVKTLKADSIGTVTDAAEVDPGMLAGCIKFAGNNNIGILGYAPNDNKTLYADVTPHKVVDIINCLANLSSDSADFLIVDCSADPNSAFTRGALEAADIVVTMLTPDFKGLVYYKSNIVLFDSREYHESQWLTFLGNVRPYHSTESFETTVRGGIDGMFPWCKDMDKTMVSGEPFGADKYIIKLHANCLKKVEVLIDAVKKAKANNVVETEE